jgi:hypothetical protein
MYKQLFQPTGIISVILSRSYPTACGMVNHYYQQYLDILEDRPFPPPDVTNGNVPFPGPYVINGTLLDR